MPVLRRTHDRHRYLRTVEAAARTATQFPINREQYAELARLSSNLNQLAKLANSGQSVTVTVTVADALLQRLAGEVGRLRLALLGAGGRA